MSTIAVVPLNEYLANSYRPDREYLDGELLERTWANGVTVNCRRA